MIECESPSPELIALDDTDHGCRETRKDQRREYQTHLSPGSSVNEPTASPAYFKSAISILYVYFAYKYIHSGNGTATQYTYRIQTDFHV